MSSVITTDIETGEAIRRPLTPDEEEALALAHAEAAAQDANERITIAALEERTRLLTVLGPFATPTWAQVETHINDAKTAIARPTAQWTNQLVADGIKLALRIALFCVARELRRIVQDRRDS